MSSLLDFIKLLQEVRELPYEDAKAAVDVINSLFLKHPHKVFGNLIKCIAEEVKTLNPPKGHWQPYWIVAMKTFECWRAGKPKNVCIDYALSAVSGMPNVNHRLAVTIASRVYDKVQDCISNSGAWVKRYYPPERETARAGRR